MKQPVALDEIARVIHTIRGHRVMLDSDLAALYGVSPKRLNEQVRRNIVRFPEDFAFQLTSVETTALRSQIATLDEPPALRSQIATSNEDASLRSQIAILDKGRGQYSKYRPYDQLGKRRSGEQPRHQTPRVPSPHGQAPHPAQIRH